MAIVNNAIGIRKEPVYPGTAVRTGVDLYIGEVCEIEPEPVIFSYRKDEELVVSEQFWIRFYKLTDGRGWVFDRDPLRGGLPLLEELGPQYNGFSSNDLYVRTFQRRPLGITVKPMQNKAKGWDGLGAVVNKIERDDIHQMGITTGSQVVSINGKHVESLNFRLIVQILQTEMPLTCLFCRNPVTRSESEASNVPEPSPRKKKKSSTYRVTFSSRPLGITIAPSIDTDAPPYTKQAIIQDVHNKEAAAAGLTVGSRVVRINNEEVEHCECEKIVNKMVQQLPIECIFRRHLQPKPAKPQCHSAPDDESRRWYYLPGGTRSCGPLKEKDLIQLYIERKIHSKTLVSQAQPLNYSKNLGQWTPITDVDVLKPRLHVLPIHVL